MQDHLINITEVEPVEIFGANNSYLKIIKSYFPTLTIVARGNDLLLKGDQEAIDVFEIKLAQLIKHLIQFKSITESHINTVMLDHNNGELNKNGGEVLVHGNGGSQIKAKTINQQKMVELVNTHDMVFAVGPAGTGKTYTAVACAVRALKAKEVKRIVLTRPAVEAGENLGFLPGDLKEKLDPYLMPLYDALRDMIPGDKLADMLELGIIEIAPLAFMRGRTLDKAFVILDEAQNTTSMQIKMFLTRMGQTAKFVITGDMSQIDLPHKQRSGLGYALDVLSDVEEIGIIRMTQHDVLRHTLVKKIIHAFDMTEAKEKLEKDQKDAERKKYRENERPGND